MNLRILAIILLLSSSLAAQKNKSKVDTLAPIRDFIKISTGYKQVPLYLDLEMKSFTNFITQEADTAAIRGEFFLRNENSYVRFGEFEQVVNDTVAVMVSNNLQQIVVYKNAGPIIKQMKGMMGMTFPDSSVKNLSLKYSSSAKTVSSQTVMVELKSRFLLPGTQLPKETITLEYSKQNNIPEKITTVRRNLMQLDSLQYLQLQQEPSLIAYLLALEGSYFLIKEQATAYVYRKIDYGNVVEVPVKVSDRIVLSGEGEYIGVNGYHTYRLIIND
jgi:hypothetical protein